MIEKLGKLDNVMYDYDEEIMLHRHTLNEVIDAVNSLTDTPQDPPAEPDYASMTMTHKGTEYVAVKSTEEANRPCLLQDAPCSPDTCKLHDQCAVGTEFYVWQPKPTESQIKGRYMSWKDEEYFTVPQINKEREECEECAFYMLDSEPCYECDDGVIWRPADEVEITDELACSRAELGPVWVMVRDTETAPWWGPCTLGAVNKESSYPFRTQNGRHRHCRLCTYAEVPDDE